jgi:adenosylhomocysteine nucleosidase
MIAITFALRAESAEFAAQLRKEKIDDRQIMIWHTGVGPKHCRLRMNQFLEAERPGFLISSGFTGGVREGLQVGDLILAENFSERQLLAKAQQILTGCRVQTVNIFTATTIINSIADRNEIARTNNAAAVDMETEVIATACAKHGVPMLSLRVVTDSLEEPFPLPPTVLFNIEQQRTDLGKLISHLLGHPVAIGRLLHFARRIAGARAILANAIVALLRSEALHL